MEEEEEEVSNNKFIGKYCDICAKCGETYYWCNSLDWEEGLLDVDNPNANTNPSLKKTPSPKIVENPQQDGSNTEGQLFRLQRKTKET